jgi:predicted DNA-binding transcriptional regulator AlpA
MTERIRFLSPKQVIELTTLSRRSLGRLPGFPKPIQIYEGSSRLGYIESEVLAWLQARVAQVRGRPAGAEPEHHPEPSPGAGGKNGHGTERADPQAARRPQRKAQPPPRGAPRPGQRRPII